MNIVYIAIGQYYFDECMISVWSLRRNANYSGGIYVLTDRLYVPSPEIIELCGSQNLHITQILVPLPPSPAHAAGLRLEVLEYLSVEAGGQLLYLDCDVVACAPFDSDTLFGDLYKGQIGFYGYREGDTFPRQRNQFMAGFLTSEKTIVSHPGFCTGVMAFYNEPKTRKFLNETGKRYAELLSSGHVNAVWEQPVICHQAIRQGVAELVLNEIVIDRFMALRNDYTDAALIHLCGPRGKDNKEMIAIARQDLDAEGWHRMIKQPGYSSSL